MLSSSSRSFRSIAFAVFSAFESISYAVVRIAKTMTGFAIRWVSATVEKSHHFRDLAVRLPLARMSAREMSHLHQVKRVRPQKTERWRMCPSA